ncbi:MAG: hypothetical protein AB9917_03170 [Negativicutes bacterium]
MSEIQIVVSESWHLGINTQHTAIVVGGTTYSYGRYGDTLSGSGSSPMGDGVLRIYSDPNGQTYIERLQQAGYETKVYTMTDLTSAQIISLVDTMTSGTVPYTNAYDSESGASQYTWPDNGEQTDSRRVYEILGDNCSSFVADAINAMIPNTFPTGWNDRALIS